MATRVETANRNRTAVGRSCHFIRHSGAEADYSVEMVKFTVMRASVSTAWPAW